MPLNTSNTVLDNNSKSPPIKTPPPPNLNTTTSPMPVPRSSPNSSISTSNNGLVVTTTTTTQNVRTTNSSSILGTTSATVGSTSGVVGSSTSAPLVSPAETATSTVSATSSNNQNKIMGRNVNGTLVMTSAPSNEAELQLYRVMQRASLLAYYDTLLEMGGDDVQQLCEAGEEEFLEIMALVGMASKPLHVRRLQKALQEWVNNPAMFQAPIMPGLSSVGTPASSSQIGSPVFPSSTSSSSQSSQLEGVPPRAINLSASLPPPPISQSPAPPQISPIQGCALTRPSPPTNNGLHPSRHGSPSPSLQLASSVCGSSGGAPSPGLPLHVHGADSLSPGSPPPLQLTPTLAEPQIQRLAESAKQLASSLPSLEPKPQNSKKRICKDLEYVMNMPEDDPRRMEEIRKYAAIYGRFDCKRKPEKPLTLHEVSVNEAAAQICRLVPALLTRRDELFPLARQVVRDSGYQYSKTHTSVSTDSSEFHSVSLPGGYSARAHNGDDVNSASATKRMRLLDPSEINQDLRRQERLEQISEELRSVAERQEELRQLATGANGVAAESVWQTQLEALNSRHAQLALEQQELGRHRHAHNRGYRRSARISAASFGDGERPDTDDTDSQFSYSNTSSPSQDVGDSRDSTTRDGETPNTNNDILSGLKSNHNKSPSKILTKQLVQETLLGEGLRVVKEMVASQQEQDGPPPAHLQGHARSQLLHHYDAFFHHENKVQVISASGGNIIAVANPALSMSPAIHANDSVDVKINSPRPSSASSHHPMTSLLAQFKHEPLSPCKSE